MKSGPGTQIVRTLVSSLQGTGIPFCHFKSNEHIGPAVNAETDLDILFASDRTEAADAVLRQAGFVRYRSPSWRRYPFVEDYIGFDPETGKLVHVHAHFRLLVGESGVKSFILPWDEEILQTALWNDDGQMPATEPAREMVLLLLRAAIKQAYPSPVSYFKKRAQAACATVSDDEREFLWLKARASREAVGQVGRRWLGEEGAKALITLYEAGPDPRQLADLFSAARGRLERFRRLSAPRAFLRRWLRWLTGIGASLIRRHQIFDIPVFRTARSDGLVIVLLGSDGAGKSTLAQALARALGKKLDVLKIYLGSGDGASSLLRRPAVAFRKKVVRRRTESSAPQASERHGGQGLAREAFKIYWAVSLALEKKSKLRRAKVARSHGMFVISDRYPQAEVPNYNDGPLLSHLAFARWSLLRKLCAWEQGCYRSDRILAPDLVLRLTAAPALLQSRRTEMLVETITRKQAGIAALRFPPSTVVKELDASLSPDIILAQAMAAIGAVILTRGADDNV